MTGWPGRDFVRIRGSVVGSRWSREWPFGRLDCSPATLEFRGLRMRASVGREEIAAIEVDTMRYPLFVHTVFTFHTADRQVMFVPYRPGLLRRTLDCYGWPEPTGTGRYRLRTWLRIHLPYVLSDRIAKGRGDCGAHEWYRAEGTTWHCYHCVVGVRTDPVDQDVPFPDG